MDKERKQFLESRQSGVGGSDVAAILGLSKWATPLDVYNSKLQPVPDEDETSEAMHFGNVLEDVVANEFTRRTGMKVQRRNKVYRHERHPELIGNIDRKIVGRQAGLECKTSSAWMADQWGEPGTDQIPVPYILQCVHYMNVTGLREWYVAALIGGNDFRWYTIPFNEDMSEYVVEKCVEFWNDHVKKQVPPAPINLDDVAKLYETTKDVRAITATDAVFNALEAIKDVKSQMKTLKETEDEAKLVVQEFMGEANTLLHPTTGDIIATWKSSESNRLNSKALKKDHADLYKEYTTLQTSRRFLVK